MGSRHVQERVHNCTTVTVRYFAAARAAAGVDEETLNVSAAGSVEDLLALVSARHCTELNRVLGRCSFLLDGLIIHDRSVPVRGTSTLDVLPPFAGG